MVSGKILTIKDPFANIQQYFKFKPGNTLWRPDGKQKFREMLILDLTYDTRHSEHQYKIRYLDKYEEDYFDAPFLETHFKVKILYSDIWQSVNEI